MITMIERDRLAKLGAESELSNLRTERGELNTRILILERFINGTSFKEVKKRRRMSPAARQAVSIRMKKYWAARRRNK